ncbi:MAG: C40 family peptidase [Patescibacteria group bacterium]|nr:C40 family peptidase [Patescibacteria group bacterium]
MKKEEKIKILIEAARSLIDSPYKYGAYLENSTENQKEFDCSSFIQFVFKKIGVELPRSTVLQAAAAGKEIVSLEEALPGNLIFFEGERGHYRHDLFPNKKIYIGHVGIFSGNGKMIHAANRKEYSGVVETDFKPEDIVLIKRVI